MRDNCDFSSISDGRIIDSVFCMQLEPSSRVGGLCQSKHATCAMTPLDYLFGYTVKLSLIAFKFQSDIYCCIEIYQHFV